MTQVNELMALCARDDMRFAYHPSVEHFTAGSNPTEYRCATHARIVCLDRGFWMAADGALYPVGTTGVTCSECPEEATRR